MENDDRKKIVQNRRKNELTRNELSDEILRFVLKTWGSQETMNTTQKDDMYKRICKYLSVK
ncbi:hypothetical protein EDD63_1169 [Breznakia blatticola]|uniref:Uncharacterized protein n=1 Tax=Breznakia blatticola TaxID=1754012 RepID=A0A4R7ZPR3_9FIRM|nr:hypothetical protein [Breznakia blatticola]TDW19913.1 hypothetical protein EDD63_1169 [Breznakia blatticola]